MKKKVLSLLVLISVFSTFVLSVSAFDQPFMKAAKVDLNKAKNALKRAMADKGGHRNNAMNLVDKAISQVEAGIAYDKKNPNNRPKRNSDFEENEALSLANADQPNMKIARDHLQNALNNLEKATADKGGYRVNAMQIVRDAISEVNKGIEYDRKN
ncbi:MAG TPA: hypothetical protein PKY59_17600 [Pyrinomonadaceae bacterium]|nr:hypothetical protein [Pyrinomonadaceae bacterium]